jgi:transposase InsO family protein
MSKARLVITAVIIEKRSVAEVAAAYGVSRSWLYELLARYRVEGEAAFEPRSRRPHTAPSALTGEVIEQVILERDRLTAAGHDAGPETIRWHLRTRGITVSRASIARILTNHGRVTPQPKKRPRSSWRTFEADQPNECWQSDFTHYRLAVRLAGPGSAGTEVEIISWLDDHARYALHVSAHPRITGPIVLATFRAAVAAHGIPHSTLTDNGMVYTVRLASTRVRGGRNAFETELADLGVIQKNSRPNHPTTCGKVERFQQTMKNWLTRQQPQPATMAELQALLDRFVHEYNQHRPHRSLPRHATPATAYSARPKATPTRSEPADRTHDRVREDRVGKTGNVTLRHHGRLHHIGIGRAHAGTEIYLLVEDLQIRVVHATTGELLRQLILDPTRDYQPQHPK